jgi:hypothetical protein
MKHEGSGVTGLEGGELMLAEPVVEGNERDAGQGRAEQGDGIGEVAGAQVKDGRVPPEPGGGGVGEAQQAGGCQRPAALGYRGPVSGRGRHLEDHADVHENAILI